VKSPAQGKAEALRQAQLALLHGAATVPGTKEERGLIDDRPDAVRPKSTEPASPTSYAHPFFWAPFVLIGNFQ
jgi:CHAT domain-containing protein